MPCYFLASGLACRFVNFLYISILKKIKQIYKLTFTVNWLVMALMLSVAAGGFCCLGGWWLGYGDNKYEVKPLKIKINPMPIFIKELKNDENITISLRIEVEEGEDKTDAYKIKIENEQCFQVDNFAGLLINQPTQVVSIMKPANHATLKELDLGDKLKQGYKKHIDILLTAGSNVQAKSA